MYTITTLRVTSGILDEGQMEQSPPKILGCRKIFFLSKHFCPTIQSLGLKISILRKTETKSKLWAT